jgi:hypothetical protein
MITTKEIKSRFERTYGGAFQGIDIITDKLLEFSIQLLQKVLKVEECTL